MGLAAVAIDSLAVKNVRPETDISHDGCYSSVLTSRLGLSSDARDSQHLSDPDHSIASVPSGTNILSVTQKIWVKISILF